MMKSSFNSEVDQQDFQEFRSKKLKLNNVEQNIIIKHPMSIRPILAPQQHGIKNNKKLPKAALRIVH
ncbi:hypothetical protein HZS_4718 [Henneguya salminicola]|nr:hypothetical protein HZS_4718 [Henneguya salminicola]